MRALSITPRIPDAANVAASGRRTVERQIRLEESTMALPNPPADGPTTSATPLPRSSHDDSELHELLTVEDVAALLKVSKNWVYEHTRSRGTPRSERLPYLKIGKYLRFEGRAVRAFLEKKCRTT